MFIFITEIWTDVSHNSDSYLHRDQLNLLTGSYKSAIGLKGQNPSLKVMLAIGGWNEGGKKYSAMAKSEQSRQTFIRSVVEFMKEHGFDGFDLDWEYPGAQDRDGSWDDKQNFASLVEELAAAFKPYNWLLSAAVSPAKFRVNDGYDVRKISQHLDFINVMTYDLHGSWDRAADHHAPLHGREHDDWDPLTAVCIYNVSHLASNTLTAGQRDLLLAQEGSSPGQVAARHSFLRQVLHSHGPEHTTRSTEVNIMYCESSCHYFPQLWRRRGGWQVH